MSHFSYLREMALFLFEALCSVNITVILIYFIFLIGGIIVGGV